MKPVSKFMFFSRHFQQPKLRNLSFPRKAKQWKDGKGIQGVQENYYNDES